MKVRTSLRTLSYFFCATATVSGAPIATGTPVPRLSAAGSGTIIEVSPDGRVSVQARQVGHHLYQTLLIKSGHHVYRIPDERVVSLSDDGSRRDFNDDTDSFYAHDFFFSTDGTWLFVTRKCMHAVCVAYLYHYVAGRGFISVRPDGLRFDDAALRYFARRNHFAVPTLESGGRVFRFQHWAAQGAVVFEFDASTDYSRPPWVRIVGRYDPHRKDFSLIKIQKHWD